MHIWLILKAHWNANLAILSQIGRFKAVLAVVSVVMIVCSVQQCSNLVHVCWMYWMFSVAFLTSDAPDEFLSSTVDLIAHIFLFSNNILFFHCYLLFYFLAGSLNVIYECRTTSMKLKFVFRQNWCKKAKRRSTHTIFSLMAGVSIDFYCF